MTCFKKLFAFFPSLILSLFFFSFSSDLFSYEATLSSYPTSQQVELLKRENPKKILIRESPHRGRRVILSWPTFEHFKSIQSLTGRKITLHIASFSYPTSESLNYLNQLGKEVTLKVDMGRCPKVLSEIEILKRLTKEAEISFRCNSLNDMRDSALVLGDLREKSPKLKITLLRQMY